MYADGRLEITRTLNLTGGVRWDNDNTFGDTLNPHAALIWKPFEGTSLKLLYAEAHPTPNFFQLEYTVPGEVGNPALSPETLKTYEAVFEQYFCRHWFGTVSLFDNDSSEAIETDKDADENIIYVNAGHTRALGAEAEIEGKWDNGLLLRASYTQQEAYSAVTGQNLVNSPERMLKTQVSVPLYRDKIFGSVELVYASNRLTLAGHQTDGAWLLNATIFSHKLAPGLEVSASVYNLLNQHYLLPVGEEFVQDSIAQDGRTLLLKLTYRFW